MNIREQMENNEYMVLSKYAAHSRETKGRDEAEELCDIRTEYQRDRDRILHSKYFRKLKHKTQVFLAPDGDYYRTRLTHTLEVSQIARSISRALRLNEDLTEAIALGHDLGHTPFGHAGEHALNEVCKYGFTHFEQSVRIVEKLEKNGKGLNLTREVRDGILNHKMSGNPLTLEGKVVRLSDKIAYINHDIDDAIKAGIFSEELIPQEYRNVLGNSKRQRINTIIHDIVNNSMDKNDIIMSDDIGKAMQELRSFMFRSVYESPEIMGQDYKGQNMLKALYKYYMEHIEEIPDGYKYFIDEMNEEPERVVCDYIAGMSDQDAVIKFEELFIPAFWKER